MSGARLGWKDDLVTALVAALVMSALVATVSDLGYARDEGFYFHAAGSYGRWFELFFSDPGAAISRNAVDGAWRVNSEHPGLVKSLFALSHLVLQKKWHLFAMEGTSYRFPAIALAGVGVGLVYRWGAEVYGRLAGLFAAAALFFMPRYFYHAHLACFDAPIVTMFLIATYAYWKAMRTGKTGAIVLAGLAFGLALDTKHNSWFLPILAIAHAATTLLVDKRSGRDPRETGRRALSVLAAMAVIGPLVMIALWPWIWRDTIPRLRAYAQFHLNHEYYNMEFFGRTYWTPPMPRLYAPVMTAATVPAVTLALFFVGLFVRGRARIRALLRGAGSDRAETELLWLYAIGVSYGAWILPKTPIFGGTKHWMTAYPFLALFAGAGFSFVVTSLRVALRRLQRRSLARGAMAAIVVFAVAMAAPVVETISSHPFGLSSYTPLVGGAKGGATLGLNRTFWGYTTGSVVEYLNREVPRGGAVYVHDTAWPAWEMLQKDGRLRTDIRGVGAAHDATFALYHHEQHMQGQEYQAWVAYGSVAPSYVAGLDGVPVIWIYRWKEK